MRKTALGLTIPLAVAAMLSVQAPAKDVLAESRWAAAPVVIDGQDGEWRGEAPYIYKDAGLEYALQNDGQSLYILFRFTNPKGLTTIEATGLNVYINAGGKKKKDFGFRFFRKQATADELIAALEMKGQVLTEEKKAELRTGKLYVLFEHEAVGEKKAGSAPVPPGGPGESPVFRAVPQGKTVVYEIRIPLSLGDSPTGIGVKAGETIKLGFEWGGMTPEMRKALMAQRASQSSQASGRTTSMDETMGGGSESVDQGSSDFSDLRRSPRKFSFWIDARLASAN